MKLTARDVFPSPDRADSCRVAVSIRMEREARDVDIWFDLPAALQDELSETGNPWLVLMVPLAMSSGEDIQLSLPVDTHLLENMQGMMRFWHSAYPELKPVHVDAPNRVQRPRAGDKRAMFFSGGVDSTFSLLRHDKEATGCASGVVDDLIFVAGFDIPLSDTIELDMAYRHLGRVAEAHGKTLLPVATNLKQLDTAYRTNWLLSYGCALGALGHLLEGRYAEIICTSEQCHNKWIITGSHPTTDALLSSRQLRFVHDGANFTRVEKTVAIAEAGEPLNALRVCWESKRHDNCSRCSKCLRTMVTLDLAGYRNRTTCFDWSIYQVENLRSLHLTTDGQTMFFQEVLDDARRRGRKDVEDVVAEIIRVSLCVRAITARLRRMPLLWRFEYQIKEFLLTPRGRRYLCTRPRRTG